MALKPLRKRDILFRFKLPMIQQDYRMVGAAWSPGTVPASFVETMLTRWKDGWKRGELWWGHLGEYTNYRWSLVAHEQVDTTFRGRPATLLVSVFRGLVDDDGGPDYAVEVSLHMVIEGVYVRLASANQFSLEGMSPDGGELRFSEKDKTLPASVMGGFLRATTIPPLQHVEQLVGPIR